MRPAAWRGPMDESQTHHRAVLSVAIGSAGGEAPTLPGALPAEEMRRRESELLRLMLDTTPHSTSVRDREGRFLLLNEATTRYFGKTPSEVVGKTLFDFAALIGPENVARLYQQDLEVINARRPIRIEVALTGPDGQPLYFEIAKSPLIEPDGSCDKVLTVGTDVTERKLAEQRVEASERRFRALVENSWDGVILTEADGHPLYCSPALLRFLGYTAEEFMRRTPADNIHPDDLERAGPELARVLATSGHRTSLTYRVPHRDGSWRWAEVIATNLTGERSVGAIVFNFHDITERRQAEEQLRAVADELRVRLRQQEAIADFSQMALATTDLDGVLARAVAVVSEILDTELSMVLELQPDGGSLLVRAGAGCREGVVGRETVPAGTASQAGYTLLSGGPVIADDLRTETRFTVPPLLGEHDTCSGLSVIIGGREGPYGVLETFTTRRRLFGKDDRNFLQSMANILASAVDRKRLEDNLRHEMGFTSTIMAALPGVMCLLDGNLRFRRWNKAIEEMTGFGADEIIRMSPLEFIPAEDREAVAEAIGQVFQNGRTSLEANLQTKDGRKVPHYLSGVRLDTEQGTYLLGIGLDVTERKRLESQFRQAQKMQVFGQMAGGVAHDFNNLLTIINGCSDVLLSRLRPDDPMRELLTEIHRAGERAGTLTRRLLAFSRQQVLEPKVLNLNTVVSDTEKMLRRLIGEDVILTTTLDPALGSVKADAGQLEQVLMNLAVNARDAMPYGGKLTIETRNAVLDEAYCRGHTDLRPGPHALLTVTDTGCGMDEATQARIFEPFFTTKGPGKGTGLGLATVHGIVKQSGGTTFMVYLPLVRQPAPGGNGRHDPTAMPRGHETILLVEDEDAVRSLGRHVLAECGYTVLEARDGREAIPIVEGHAGAIDLVVCDVVMPHLGGRDLAERTAALRPGCKVLFLSGHAYDDLVRQGIQGAEFAFLQKPYGPAALAQKVREVLDRPP